MYDEITKIGDSIIQHGKLNDRIYLQKLAKSDLPIIIDRLNEIATQNNYSKLFAKVPEWALDNFIKNDFEEEAFIPKFYNAKTDVFFLGKFLDESRERITKQKELEIEKNINLAEEKETLTSDKIELQNDFSIRGLSEFDIIDLVELYKIVFDSYPFPIYDPDYIKETMKTHIKYFGVFENGKLVAASSAEMDKSGQNCEMTDFATNPNYRGKGFATNLLLEMETEVRDLQIKTLYTIARSHSAGMNITFSKMGYEFSGTLINNTNISGNIESMNVWYKHL